MAERSPAGPIACLRVDCQAPPGDVNRSNARVRHRDPAKRSADALSRVRLASNADGSSLLVGDCGAGEIRNRAF